MRYLLLFWAVAACACGYDPEEVQTIKSPGVKGGGTSRYIYKGGDNINNRFYSNQQVNLTKHNEVEEIGVCYIEIPTAQLVSDQRHVPAGNGSRPELSRIRTCCRGYTRNIHDFMVCDPICSKGCVNSLCVAPETCQCYPDYVKNSAGFCVATCPIGCQHGHCAGGECICDYGYRLDSDSKYCIPDCKNNCGGFGNCTAPNVCSCQPGYQPTPEGSCKQPGSEYSPQYHVLPVQPLPSSNQVLNSSHPQSHNMNQYPNPYNPNYPQGPYYQYPGNNPYSYPHGSSDRSPNNTHGQEGQMSRRPEENFYPNQGQPYPYPTNQYPNQGSSTQKPDQRPGQQPNQYPGYPSVNPLSHPNEANPSYPHRGDIDSDNKYPYPTPGQTSPNNTSHTPGSIYPQLPNYNPNYQESNSYYAGGRQQNSTWNGMNQYGSQDHSSGSFGYSGKEYDYTHHMQSGQRPLYATNQTRYNSTQRESYDASNQTSYDSSSHHSFGSTQHNQFDSDYQSHYGNFNRDTQNSHGQYDQRSHGQSNQGSQNSINQDNQGQSTFYQGGYGSSQQGSYDSSRRDTQDSRYQGSYDSSGYQTQGSSNQTTYPYYNSMGSPGPRPEVSNQVSNQTGAANSSHHTTQEEYHHNFDLDQQTNDVPVCSMPCINGYCVEGNECRCKPGYIPDRINPNMCLPHCPGGCPNGVCSGPRLCLCNAGYYKDTSIKGRQVCVKKIK